MYLLSIIVPVFNSAAYIDRTIQSIADSLIGDNEQVEVLLIDDGSQDSSLDIMNKVVIDKSNFRVITKKHSGVSATRNLGIKEAQGKYLTFFDSDDLFNAGYVKRLVTDIQGNHPDFIIMDCYPEIKKTITLENDAQRIKILEDLVDIGPTQISSGPHGKFYRASFIKQQQIFFKTELVMAEDLMFNFDVIKRAGTVIMDSFAFYRTLEVHSMYRFKEYNLKNEMLFNDLLQKYFSDFSFTGKNRPLVKLKLTGYMFLLNWYFAELLRSKKLSLTQGTKQIRKIAEDGGYKEAFNDSEFDKVIGHKHALFRKLMNKGHYRAVLQLNAFYWKVRKI